jgi:hypothetical protein
MKTVFELIEANGLTLHGDIEHFAELVRVESFKEIAEKVKSMPWESDTKDSFLVWLKEQA